MAECIEGDCKVTKIVGRKRCTRHYQQWRKDHAPECSRDDCKEPAQCKGLCPRHYQQQRAQHQDVPLLLPAGRWRPVAGYEGLYLVSDLGEVYSLPRATTRGQLIRPRRDPNGYLQVTLSKDGEHTTHRVHILVLTAFRGLCPPGKEGAHDDGDKDNCRLDNLFWKTRAENIRDVVRHGRHNNGNKTHCRWGHQFTSQNTRYSRTGRVCKTCDRTRSCQKQDCALPTHDHINTPWKTGSRPLTLVSPG
jgi:NUMOD4 motif/HNH endonuclease